MIETDRKSKHLLLFVLHGCEALIMLKNWTLHGQKGREYHLPSNQAQKKHQDFIMDDILPYVTTFYLLSFFWRKIGEVKISELLFTTVHMISECLTIFRYCTSKILDSSSQKYWFLKSSVSNFKCERSVLDIQPVKNQYWHSYDISFLVNENSNFFRQNDVTRGLTSKRIRHFLPEL